MPSGLTFEEDEEDHRFASGVLRTIESLRHMPLWEGQPPRMRPSSRVAFFGAGRRLLLDSVFDWDDYLFVATALVRLLICEMESGKPLAERGYTELPYKKKMEENIRQLEEQLARIKDLGSLYGLNAGMDEPTVRDNAEKPG